MGVQRGVPDLLVFDPPPNAPADIKCPKGVAIEMKSAEGKVSIEQAMWLTGLRNRGWVVYVARSATDAIEFLKRLGY